MALIEGGLRGFDQVARGSGRGERGFEFEFGGSVERDGAESLRAVPALGDEGRDGFVKRAQRRRRGNFRKGVGGIGVPRS